MAKQELPLPDTDLRDQLHAFSQRISYVEERYKNFDGRLRQLQKNVVDHHQELRKIIRDIDKQLVTIKGALDLVTDRLKTLRNEVLLRASKEDLDVLKKYIDLWNPFQFVTADQVESIVEDVLANGAANSTKRAGPKESAPQTEPAGLHDRLR